MPARTRFSIDEGTADVTLRQFARQAGREILFAQELVRGVRTNAVRGAFSVREGLDRLLSGTQLEVLEDAASGGLTVRTRTNPKRSALPSSDDRAQPSRSSAEDVIELSPFEVQADSDVGYQASNTTSGSRLNSRLKDTPASISPFTPEFLSDIGATNLQEMLNYGTNIELDVEDTTAGFSDSQSRFASSNNGYQFRARGVMGGTARDFVDSAVPVDFYNIERADVSSGPNAVLFGLGAQGGTVALTGKRAGLKRDRTSVKNTYGSWDYRRSEIDSNQVLLPGKAAVRLLGLYQDAEGWRRWDLHESRRLTAAVALQPTKTFSLRASLEAGNTADTAPLNWNAEDQVTRWFDAGQPIADGAAVTGTSRLSTSSNRYTFYEQEGAVYNLKGELQSTSRYPNTTLSSPALFPYDINVTGPGGLRYQNFSSYDFQAEWRLDRDFTLAAAVFHNQAHARVDAITGSSEAALRADPNLTTPLLGGGTRANPHAGEFYLESPWFRDKAFTENDVARLSSAWSIDAGRLLGQHRIAALVERSFQHRTNARKYEIFVDDDNVPINTIATPEGGQNRVYRRRYFTAGNLTDAYAGDLRAPTPTDLIVNGRSYHSGYASTGQRTTSDAKKRIDSFLVASQDTWWNGRFVTTLGYRFDRVRFDNATQARVTDPNDPRVRSHELVLNEWNFDGTWTSRVYDLPTFSTGAVLHANSHASLFYNYSKNNGSPRFDRLVAPTGTFPPPSEGEGRDFGLMLDFFGDDRYFIRATRYSTIQRNDAAINPGEDALGVTDMIGLLDSFLSAGKISPAEYDAQAVHFGSAVIDQYSEGYEVEFVANPTPSFTGRIAYSHTTREPKNFFKEVYAFYEPRYAAWRSLAAGNAALLANVEDTIASIDSLLSYQTDRQNRPIGLRPDKANATGRYTFREGGLKGLFLGGGLRYQGRNYIKKDTNTGREYWGSPTLFCDAFAGYRTRLPWGRNPVSAQLNVTNLTNSYLVGTARYNGTYDGLFRVYLNEPRRYRLTVTVEF